ncbi:M24 family metallopeptidase [Mycobacterium paraintracellulare]|uniref:M24 family metallopeptidase n=2 Tax=Mycobacterium avium complex (MAC) TaxID=120793 RepID=UPI001938B392|nr:Xaa-Pro peptidase family protein [Mycobacterium paraintracellulare]BCP05404.1 peptidase [Mycobacterium paraintracellulare]
MSDVDFAVQRTEFTLDLPRMRRDRHAKLTRLMANHGLDGLVLTGTANVQYAVGANAMTADASHTHAEPLITVLPAGGSLPHLFTPYPEGVPPEIPPDHVHPTIYIDFDEGVDQLGSIIGELIGTAPRRVALDQFSGAVQARLPGLLPKLEMVDAVEVMSEAKICKTADEIECIRRAQVLNETAMNDVYTALRVGVRQTDLSAVFLKRMFELGGHSNVIDPIWQVMPPSIKAGPFTVNGDVAFPTCTTDRILRWGDLIMCDSGMTYEGYMSDFGRTWIVGVQTANPRQRRHFEEWRDIVNRVLDVVRPGSTGGDLTRAAGTCRNGRMPWLKHFYLAHGVGTETPEPPLIGTDLGPEFDESVVLAPGMVFLLEPVVWEDGYGGYRAEEAVVVTDTGYEVLTSGFPYDPFTKGIVEW